MRNLWPSIGLLNYRVCVYFDASIFYIFGMGKEIDPSLGGAATIGFPNLTLVVFNIHLAGNNGLVTRLIFQYGS